MVKNSICSQKNIHCALRKKKGGDLGEIHKGQLVKPVEKIIFNQALKKIHGPVKSKFGFHLIKIYYRD
jgi:peptidyl-prolyl cis-trans isomerase C